MPSYLFNDAASLGETVAETKQLLSDFDYSPDRLNDLIATVAALDPDFAQALLLEIAKLGSSLQLVGTVQGARDPEAAMHNHLIHRLTNGIYSKLGLGDVVGSSFLVVL